MIVLLIGAQKSGTTTLSQEIANHPDVLGYNNGLESQGLFLSNSNDPNHLDLFGGDRDTELRRSRCYFEFSNNYSWNQRYPAPINKLKETKLDIKIIYIVRHPIDRIESEYRMSLPKGIYKQGISQLSPDAINKSMYKFQINPYLKAFGRNNIFLVHFEQFIRNHHPLMKKLYTFIGVDGTHVNKTSSLRNRKPGEPWVQQLYFQHTPEGAFIEKIKSSPYYLGRVIAPLISKQHMYRKTSYMYTFNTEQRDTISSLFNDDRLWLEQEFQIDLSSWDN